MRQAQPSPIVAGVGKVLHERLEGDVHEPLPERWVETIFDHSSSARRRSSM